MSSPERSELARRILSGDSPELKRLAAEGLAPLPVEELLEVQVALAADADGEVAFLARRSLAAADPRVVATALQEAAPPQVVAHFARETSHEALLEAIVRRRDVAPDLLVEVAPRVPPAIQEALLLRQDAIVERPEILEALARNPQLTPSAARRIAEYREHLVRSVGAAEAAAAPAEGLEEDLGEEPPEVTEIRAAFEEAERSGDEERQRRVEQLNVARIRELPVAARLHLTRRAPRALRMLLVRDQNPLVALGVMRFSRLNEDEVEVVAKSRLVLDDVLEAIASDRTWSRRYAVVESLIRNPKTPVNIALRLLPRLTPRSLKEVVWDRNIAAAVRDQAKRLYTIRTR